MHRHTFVIRGVAAIAATLGSIAFIADDASAQAVVSERTIAIGAAQEAATVAMEQCRRDGYRVTVTVVNRAGQIKVVLRDEGANPHTVENSFRKAYTSLTFRLPSGDIGRRPTTTIGAVSILQLANTTGGEGALPIRAGNDIIGAIGVSGAPGGEKDLVCAQAGIDKIASGLTGG